MFMMDMEQLFILSLQMVLFKKHIVMQIFHPIMIKWLKFSMKLLDIIFFKFLLINYNSKSRTTTSIGDAYAYQTYLKDNYGINIDISDLEQVYGKNNITS